MRWSKSLQSTPIDILNSDEWRDISYASFKSAKRHRNVLKKNLNLALKPLQSISIL